MKALKLSRFLGIVIGMFYREHGVPHIHAVGEHEVSIEIETGMVHGQFPPRALKLALEAEVLENWQLAKERQPLKRIAPLELCQPIRRRAARTRD